MPARLLWCGTALPHRGRPRVTDHYRLLQVRRDASPEVISAAYRRLMRDAHPDRGGDAAYATRLNIAYEVLSDPDARRAYDRGLPPEDLARTDRSLAEHLAFRLGVGIRRQTVRLRRELQRMRDEAS